MQIAMTSLANDLAEGQDAEDAASSTAAELSSRQQMLAIYDSTDGCWPRKGATATSSSRCRRSTAIPDRRRIVSDRDEEKDDDDRHRLGVRRVTIGRAATTWSWSAVRLESTDEELASLRQILGYVVPIALSLPGLADGFWHARVSRQSWRWRTAPDRLASRT